MRLIILFLFTNKDETDLRIVNHILNLLFTARCIERNRHCTNAESAKISIQGLYTVLRKDAYILLHFHSHVEHRIRNLFHPIGELVP